MKLKAILDASEPLKRLTEKNFSNFKAVRLLVKLRKAVQDEVDFYLEEEKKAIEKYAVKDENGSPVVLDGGRIQLKDSGSKKCFDERISELRETDIDGITAVSLADEDFRSKEDIPSPNDVFLLEGFVEFRGE